MFTIYVLSLSEVGANSLGALTYEYWITLSIYVLSQSEVGAYGLGALTSIQYTRVLDNTQCLCAVTV